MDLHTLIATHNVLVASDLSYSEFMVLGYVAEHPNTIVGSIGTGLSMQPAHTSRILNQLEQQGLVVRTLDGTDKRKLRVNLTVVGAKFHSEVQQELAGIKE